MYCNPIKAKTSYKFNNFDKMLELLYFISKVLIYDDYKQNIKGNKYTL